MNLNSQLCLLFSFKQFFFLEFELSSTQKEMVVSFLFVGGAFGAGVGGTLCDKIGRKKAILITDIMFIIGAIVLFLAYSFTQVLIGRILVGFAVAVSGIADVAYLHEISPIEWRGAIVSVNEACISLGFLVSYLAGDVINRFDGESGWRYMFGAGSIIALFQFIGMIFMPESPVWLEANNKLLESQIAFAMISATSNEYNSYQQPDLKTDGSDNQHRTKVTSQKNTRRMSHESTQYIKVEAPNSITCRRSPNGGLSSLTYSDDDGNITRQVNNETKVPPEIDNQKSSESDEQIITSGKSLLKRVYLEFYPQIIISVFISIMQQFCGHPNVLNYAPEIFNEVGVTSLLSMVLVGVVKFVVTCLVIWKIEQLGRKFLLLLGMSIIAGSLLLLLVAFASLDEDGELTKMAQVSAIIGIFGVACGYACR